MPKPCDLNSMSFVIDPVDDPQQQQRRSVTAVRLVQDAGNRHVAAGAGGEAIVSPAEPVRPWPSRPTVVSWGHEHARHRH
jgi:hypothetical protein